MHATQANRPQMQCKYDRTAQGKFHLPVCQDHNFHNYITEYQMIPKLLSPDKKIHEELHCSRHFQIGYVIA